MSVRIFPWKPDRLKNRWMGDIRFRNPDGSKVRDRQVYEARTAAGARRLCEAREALLRSGSLTLVPKSAAVPSWDDFWEKFIADGEGNLEKQSSLTSKRGINRTHLSPAFGTLTLDCITDERVSKFRAGLAKRDGRKGGGLSAKTVANVMTVLNAALKLAVKWKLLPAMPCTIEIRLVSDASPEFYDFDDYARLCGGAEKVGTGTEVLVRLGGEAGLRRGEMMALRRTDCDFRRRQIHIEQAAWQHSHKQAKALGVEDITRIAKPKGGRGRVVPMTDALYEALQTHKHLRGAYVLCLEDGSMVPGHILRDWLEAAQRRAGLEELGALHKLRHTFCSHLAMRGAPAKAIQELAGHTTLTVTMRYMHLSPGALDQAIALLNPKKVGATVGATQSH